MKLYAQTHAPAKFSVIVFILMRFRPSTLIRIYMRFCFQIDAFAMKTLCVLVRTEGQNTSKCMRFRLNALVWTRPKSPRVFHIRKFHVVLWSYSDGNEKYESVCRSCRPGLINKPIAFLTFSLPFAFIFGTLS